MPINIKSQVDYLLTEVSLDQTSNLADLDQIMRSTKATGKIIVSYSQGGLNGINIEQKARIKANVSDEVRQLIGIDTREID